jgi:predicted dehydrogenase
MSNPNAIRIGFIGAGGICRTRHLPGLKALSKPGAAGPLPPVEVVAVCNRSHASAQKVARDFAIPEVIDDWHDLLARPDIDAVFIGTWPYMHKELSIAALEAGKHVFCQARMAMDLGEAKAMCVSAAKHPHQVSMICPPPHRMPFEPFVRHALAGGMLGPLTAVQVVSISGGNREENQVTWRERGEFSGRQAMALGILAETLNAWVGPYQRLAAEVATPLATKRDAAGPTVNIAIPQVLTITGRLESGALAVEQHLGLAADKTTPGESITLWGQSGTLRHQFLSNVIEYAPAGEELKPVAVPAELQRAWQVEADFIAAVAVAKAGRSWSVSPDFNEALLYMRKVEAVYVSAAEGRAVVPAEL